MTNAILDSNSILLMLLNSHLCLFTRMFTNLNTAAMLKSLLLLRNLNTKLVMLGVATLLVCPYLHCGVYLWIALHSIN